MLVKTLRNDLVTYLAEHGLTKKWAKCRAQFEDDPFYPSLHVELLEPKERRIYSLRLDRKYRALFIYLGNQEIEIVAFTNHYK
jgi:plasmid maintenance system killer protein